MSNTINIAANLCSLYIEKELPKELLTMRKLLYLLYLTDWRSAIKSGTQLTDIAWIFDHYGPHTPTTERQIKESDLFKVYPFFFDKIKPIELIYIPLSHLVPDLPNDEKDVVKEIIEIAKNKPGNLLIKLVYSTYPLVTGNRMEYMDLVSLAKEYQDFKGKKQVATT